GQLGVVVDAVAQDRLPAGEAPVGQTMAKSAGGGGFAATAGQGAELQHAIGVVGQNDRSALRVKGADGIVEDAVQEVFLTLRVSQMMPGPQQRQQLLAWPGTAVAIVSKALKRVLPRTGSRRLHDQLVRVPRFGRALTPQGV